MQPSRRLRPHRPTGPRGSAPDTLLAQVARHSLARLIAVGAASTTSAASLLALPAALGHALDLLLRAPHSALTHTWILIGVALTATAVAADAATQYLTGATDARNTAWLRRLTIRHITAAGPVLTTRLRPGDLVGRTTASTADTAAATTAAAKAIAALALPLGGLTALGLLSPWLLLAFLAGAPALALLLHAFTRDTTACVAAYLRAQGRLAAYLVEALGGARTIAAAGTEQHELRRVLSPLSELGTHGRRTWEVLGRTAGQTAVVVPVLQILVLTCGGLLLTAGRLSVGELLAAARYAALAAGVGTLTGSAAALARGRAAAARLTAGVLDTPAVSHGTRRLPPGDGELALVGVCAGNGVLQHLDLTVPGGRTTAVVGPSGTGKSLLAALAGRLLDPEAGEVRLDGVPLPALSRAELRSAVGYAFARPALLGATLADTIALGAPEASPEEIASAARSALADDFIRRLPRGYLTPCAEAPLSGGEAQRLGLARAFAQTRRGRLLILDDATSSLDTATELRIQQALLDEVAAPTRLVVAHRATTAARADQVVWLDGRGGVRAVAPHAVLWQDPGYRALFRADTPEDQRPAPAAEGGARR